MVTYQYSELGFYNGITGIYKAHGRIMVGTIQISVAL